MGVFFSQWGFFLKYPPIWGGFLNDGGVFIFCTFNFALLQFEIKYLRPVSTMWSPLSKRNLDLRNSPRRNQNSSALYLPKTISKNHSNDFLLDSPPSPTVVQYTAPKYKDIFSTAADCYAYYKKKTSIDKNLQEYRKKKSSTSAAYKCMNCNGFFLQISKKTKKGEDFWALAKTSQLEHYNDTPNGQ